MRRITNTLGLTLILAQAGCFRPPDADVQFSCNQQSAPECPDGYSCEADGCCHRDGSDVEANLGQCKLNPESGSDTEGDPTEGSTETGGDPGS